MTVLALNDSFLVGRGGALFMRKMRQHPQDGWVIFCNSDATVQRWLDGVWEARGRAVELKTMLREANLRFRHFPGDVVPSDKEAESIRETYRRAGEGNYYREYVLKGGRVYRD